MKIPFFGAVSYLTLAVTPFCIVFAVVWAVCRRASWAWIGQDILVRTVLSLFAHQKDLFSLISSPGEIFSLHFLVFWTELIVISD